MKRAVSGAICLILSVIMIVPAFAAGVELKLDGYNKNNEWYQYSDTYTQLLNLETSSNNIESAGVMYALDSSQSAVWFLFSFNCKGAPKDMSPAGIKFRVKGSEEIILQMGESEEAETELVNDDYSIKLCMTLQRDNSILCEIKAVIKNGVGNGVSCSAVFIDNEGVSSIKKGMTAKSQETTTATTTEKTTKETTTKATTKSKDKAAVNTERSTRERTSYSSRITTKAALTSAAQTTEKTTRVNKTTKAKTSKKSEAYEPEYISSETVEDTSVTATISATMNETDGVSLTSAYKLAAGIGAIALLAVVGVWAVRNHNDASKADKEEALPEEEKDKKEDK